LFLNGTHAGRVALRAWRYQAFVSSDIRLASGASSCGRVFAKPGHVPLRFRLSGYRLGRILFVIVALCWTASVTVGLSVAQLP
jgi:hypothetical protein